LPDWHPWEEITDFYVSHRETGGCREIVPFELTWMVDVLGFPENVQGYYLKTGILDIEIEDVYAVSLQYPDFAGTLMVDVTSIFYTRSLILNLEGGQLRWNWEDQFVALYDAHRKRKVVLHEPMGRAHAGYNENIIEEMYVEEMNRFLAAVRGETDFPNSLGDDIKVLELLHQLESQRPNV
jgi:hypothetical protein